MVTLTSNKNIVSVHVNGVYIGTVQLSENPHHKQHCYIKLELRSYDCAISAELFGKLSQLTGRTLQTMVNSDDAQITSFLSAGGFVCKRKCYEVEANRSDYVGAGAKASLLCASMGEEMYALCCKIMYGHYIETHRDVNPWTAELADFCENLPAEAVYEADDGEIVDLAFVEGNEIAYICGADERRFVGFAASLVNELFLKHDAVCFESDDCDWAAMRLRSMFAHQDETSFDTYIYDCRRLR